MTRANLPTEPWRLDAACIDHPLEVFFPTRSSADTIRAAKQVCAECLVRAECLNDAVATREPYGIRGGKTPYERRQMRASHPRPQPIRHGTTEHHARRCADRNGGTACPACQHAATEARRHRQAVTTAPIEHGTNANQYRRCRTANNGTACDACLAANRAETAAYRNRARQVAA